MEPKAADPDLGGRRPGPRLVRAAPQGREDPLVLAAGLIVLADHCVPPLPRPAGGCRPSWPASPRCSRSSGALPAVPRHLADAWKASPYRQGVVLETPEEIRARAGMIYQQVWVTRVMPPGNLTISPMMSSDA